MLQKLIAFVKSAGAAKERLTSRNGFVSWHAEAHAIAVGLGLGFSAFATGQMQMLGLFLPAVSAGLRGKSAGSYSRILTDVVQEPHYAVCAFALGAVLGVMAATPLYFLGFAVVCLVALTTVVYLTGWYDG